MKTSHTLMRISCLLATSAALVTIGCSKKSETSATPAAAPAASKSAAPSASTVSAPVTDAAKAAADTARLAKEKAEAEAKALVAEAKRKADEAAVTAAAAAKKKVDEAAATAAAEAKKKADEAAAAVAAAAKAPAPAAMADAAASAGAATGSTAAVLKMQAEQLLSQYSGELATLKSGAIMLKGLIDKNAGMLPAGVAEKYKEFNALLPGLSSMVDSLKDYQTADLTSLVPKLKADFGNAQKLYTEIKGMLPAM
jgi:colicin import membrane protein